MAKAYLYRNVGTAEAPSVLLGKISDEVGVTPIAVQTPSEYLYVTFAEDLTAPQKAILDDFVAAREGVFAASDGAPSTGIAAIGVSPGGAFWAIVVDNLGTVTASPVN